MAYVQNGNYLCKKFNSTSVNYSRSLYLYILLIDECVKTKNRICGVPQRIIYKFHFKLRTKYIEILFTADEIRMLRNIQRLKPFFRQKYLINLNNIKTEFLTIKFLRLEGTKLNSIY